MKKIIKEALFGNGYELTDVEYEVMGMFRAAFLFMTVLLITAGIVFKITGGWEPATILGLLLATVLTHSATDYDAE